MKTGRRGPFRKPWRGVILAAAVLTAGAVAALWLLVPRTLPIPRLRVELAPAGARGLFADVTEALRAAAYLPTAPGSTYQVTAVAYSPSIRETDRTPCFTANGERVRREGFVATNFLPLGTCIRISAPTVGERTLRVADRMNERYNGVPIIDVLHPTRAQAKAFGARLVRLDILSECPAELLLPPGAPEAPDGDVAPPPPKPAPVEPLGTRLRSFWGRLFQFIFFRADILEEEDCFPT